MPRPPRKAQAIADKIAAKIVSGGYAPGARLAETELAREHACDRSTIRNAVKILAGQGHVVMHPGAGIQVRNPSDPAPRDMTDITRQIGQWRGFASSIEAAGQTPFTETTIREIVAGEDLALRLGVPVASRVLERARVQGAVGFPPMQLSVTYIRWEYVEMVPLLLQVNTGGGGMYSRLAEVGVADPTFEERFTAAIPTPAEQELLQLSEPEPVILAWRTAYTRDDRIIDVTRRVVVTSRSPILYRYGPGA
jgi:GntR family transcriptional regulator